MSRLHLHQPARYRLVVGGHVGNEETVIWPSSLTCHHNHTRDGVPLTTLEGTLDDQAVLHGILAQIRDRGLPLYLVRRLDHSDPGDRH